MQLTRTRAAVGGVALTAALVCAGAAGAGVQQSFSDVGPSHPFRADIDRMVEAGITTGYADGTFRPGAAVSRQAMSAFLGRSLPAIAVAWDDPIGPYGGSTTPSVLVAKSVDLPWGEGATQQVVVRGVVDWRIDRTLTQACTTQADGACSFQLAVRYAGETLATSTVRVAGDWDGGVAVVEAVVAVPDGGDFAPSITLTPGPGITTGSIVVGQAQLTIETTPFALEPGLPL
jgi:Flp pilus assembly protein TadG